METQISGGMTGSTMGPYRATKLWNDVIRSFRTGVPLGRHRRYMRTYDNCFVADEAVDWLHDHLKANPVFGLNVTRAQTIQLLQKFHKSRVFEDVRGSKHNRGDLSDNGRLFKFTHNSPIKTARAPLGSRTNLNSRPNISQPFKVDHEKLAPVTCLPAAGLPECRLVARPLTQQEVEDTWKTAALDNLEKSLGLDSLDEILDSSLVSGQSIMHNCLFVNKNGVVTNIDPHGPNKTDAHLPQYPGFEKDVFRVVVEYFQGLREPLLTHDMYEVITNVYVWTENRFVKHSSPNMTEFLNTPSILSSFASVENLIMNLTMNSAGPCYRRSVRNGQQQRKTSLKDSYGSTSSLHLSNADPVAESSNIYGTKRYGSVASLPVQPVTRYETAFGPDNRTVTRVFYTSAASESGNCGSSASSDFFSRGCLETDLDQQVTWHNKFVHNGTTNDGQTNLSQTKAGKFLNRHRTRANSGPNGPVHVSRLLEGHSRLESYDSTRDQSGSHLDYCTLPRNRQGQATRTDSFNHAVVKATPPINANASRSTDKDSSSVPSGKQSPMCGIDNPSFNFDQRSENAVTAKPPPYKPPPSYSHKERHRSGCSLPGSDLMNKFQLPRPPRIHVQVEHCRDTDQTAMFGPGYKVPSSHPLTRRRCSSFSQLSASPIVPDSKLSTPSFAKRCGSYPNLSAKDMTENMQQSLQLALLLLPPANRRKLHLLLRMISKMLENEELSLDNSQSMRTLLLEKFSRSILRSPEEADMEDLLVLQILGFLVDNYADIMTVPKDLKTAVENQLVKMKQSSAQIVYSLEDPSMLTYCKQVSVTEFEKQKMSHSQRAIVDLLEGIVNDTGMSQKDKKKRLKEFQKTYPGIYDRRFPTKESEAEIFPDVPKIKQPLLSRPLQKLRNIRF